MSDEKKKKAFIIRDFTDAGTERNYTGGSIVPIEEGSFVNYEAAGLVRAPTADDQKAAAGNTASSSTASTGATA